MEEQKWEFCQLHLNDWEKAGSEYRYALSIWYMADNSSYYKSLASKERGARTFKYDPFYPTMGSLGAAGWELVSVQHSGGGGGGGFLMFNDIVAYFKRPVKPGRKVDEPAIVLP